MPPTTATVITETLQYLQDDGISISQFLVALVHPDNSALPLCQTAVKDLARNLPQILKAFDGTPPVSKPLNDWSIQHVTEACSADLLKLAHQNTGFHYPVKDLTEDRIVNFNVEEYATQLEEHGPTLWHVFGRLFETATEKTAYMREYRKRRTQNTGSSTSKGPRQADVDMEDVGVGDKGSSDDEGPDVGSFAEGDEEAPEDLNVQLEDRHIKNVRMVCASTILNRIYLKDCVQRQLCCISILMNTVSQKCNALQMVVGVFLQSANTPEVIRELLARLGFSISVSNINNAIKQLSANAEDACQRLARTLLALFAYDNLDIDLKKSSPKIEDSTDTQIHITSATMCTLHPDITTQDLDCADEVWKTSEFNRDGRPPKVDIIQLMGVQQETPPENPAAPLRRDRCGRN